MLEFARLPQAERNVYFEQVADRRDLTKRLVEKDFWVCFTLRFVFSIPQMANKLVFKGGTSLSKVFGIIDRFSEDVDLSEDPDWLGFGGVNRPDAAPSRSQFDKRLERLSAACASTVDETLRPPLEEAIRSALGPRAHGGSYLAFRLDDQTQSPVLTFHYPTTEADGAGHVHPQVKLELGSLTDQRPIGVHSVTPWVAEEFPDAFAEPSCRGGGGAGGAVRVRWRGSNRPSRSFASRRRSSLAGRPVCRPIQCRCRAGPRSNSGSAAASMPAELRFTPLAERDVAEAYAWCEDKRAGLGEDFL